jgi:hypothetical protein
MFLPGLTGLMFMRVVLRFRHAKLQFRRFDEYLAR